ncbi:MAG: hypothetical protein ACLSHU_03785 [Oscillospiraceae bacterium]
MEHYRENLYFESAAMILTLITLGKFLETRAKGKTGDAIRQLMDLAPKTATRSARRTGDRNPRRPGPGGRHSPGAGRGPDSRGRHRPGGPGLGGSKCPHR